MTAPQYFSRLGKIASTHGGNLPHWSQRCATFVTFRLGDSLPQGKLEAFKEERRVWLSEHPEPWDESTASEYRELFPARFQTWLDAGYGSCILRDAAARKIVEDALRHFADARYSLYAFVVMPNHVHVLFMPEEGFDGRALVQSWKSFTAKAINRALRREGSVWQKESYDHLVRNVDEFNAIRSYIRDNNPQLSFDAYASYARRRNAPKKRSFGGNIRRSRTRRARKRVRVPPGSPTAPRSPTRRRGILPRQVRTDQSSVTRRDAASTFARRRVYVRETPRLRSRDATSTGSRFCVNGPQKYFPTPP